MNTEDRLRDYLFRLGMSLAIENNRVADMSDYERGQFDALSRVWNDISSRLRPPETPAQAAERVAEHAEETRLDLMVAADADAKRDE